MANTRKLRRRVELEIEERADQPRTIEEAQMRFLSQNPGLHVYEIFHHTQPGKPFGEFVTASEEEALQAFGFMLGLDIDLSAPDTGWYAQLKGEEASHATTSS